MAGFLERFLFNVNMYVYRVRQQYVHPLTTAVL